MVQLFLDRPDNGHGIGTGYLDNAQADAGLVVEPGQLAFVFQAVCNRGDLVQTDGGSFPVGNDQITNVLDSVEFQIELDEVFCHAAHEITARELNVVDLKGTDDVTDCRG